MKREWLIPAGLLVLSLGMRLPYAGVFPESWDSVDFALGLDRYDLRAMQPHFPGYPFFILPAHFFMAFIENEYLSLSLVSVLAGAASVIIFYCIARLWLSAWWSMAAALWFSLHPLVWLASEQPMSDAAGLALGLLLLWLVGKSLKMPAGDIRHGRLLSIGAAFYAALLGTRLSAWPFGLALVLPAAFLLLEKRGISRDPARWRYVILAAALGFSLTFLWIWAVSLGEGGIVAFFRLGRAFTEGHFEQWGNTAFTDASEGQRLGAWLAGGWYRSVAVGAGPGEPPVLHAAALLAIALAGAGVVRMERKLKWFAAVWVFPYGLWVYLGQNVDKPRHLLPLVPAFILAAAYGAFRLGGQPRWKPWAAGALGFLIAVHGWLGFSLVREHRFDPPPVLKLARYLKQADDAADMVVFTWEEERVIREEAPEIRTERLRSFSVFEEALRRNSRKRHILLTGKVVDGFGPLQKAKLLPHLQPVARFRGNPRLDPVYHDIILYEWKRNNPPARPFNEKQPPIKGEEPK